MPINQQSNDRSRNDLSRHHSRFLSPWRIKNNHVKLIKPRSLFFRSRNQSEYTSRICSSPRQSFARFSMLAHHASFFSKSSFLIPKSASIILEKRKSSFAAKEKVKMNVFLALQGRSLEDKTRFLAELLSATGPQDSGPRLIFKRLFTHVGLATIAAVFESAGARGWGWEGKTADHFGGWSAEALLPPPTSDLQFGPPFKVGCLC